MSLRFNAMNIKQQGVAFLCKKISPAEVLRSTDHYGLTGAFQPVIASADNRFRAFSKAIFLKKRVKVDSQGVAHRQKQGTTGYACACTGYALTHAFFKDTIIHHER